jgi:probable O-glycosylation ligase (exosortase A-associated)
VFGLILVYVLTAVGVVGSFVQPLIGLFVYIFFSMLRPQYMWQFAGNMDGMSQYVGIAMIIGWVLKGMGAFNVGRGKSIVAALLGFTVWAVISAYMSPFSEQANVWVIELLKIVAPFVVGVTLLKTRELIHWMMWVIVGAHGYIAFDMNQWYYIRGFNYVHESGYGYMDNNSFGLSLVIAIGLGVALALGARRPWEKLLALLCIALMISTLMLTYSRGSMLGLFVMGFVAILLIPKKPTYIALTLGAALLTGRLMGPQVVARFETVFAEEEERDNSAQSRVELWNACYQIALDNPILGIGPRGFPRVAANYGFTANKEAHSTWMQTMAEMGFFGVLQLAAFYLLTMARLFPIAWRRWTPETRDQGAFAFGIVIALTGFFVSAQFVTMVGAEAPYYVVMVGVAILNLRAAQTVAESATLPAPARTLTPGSRTFRPVSATLRTRRP